MCFRELNTLTWDAQLTNKDEFLNFPLGGIEGAYNEKIKSINRCRHAS